MTRVVGSRSRLWSGLILVVVGALLLLDNLHYIRFGEFARTWWPSLLILFGLWHLAHARHRRIGGALFWILFGVLLQVDRLNLFPWWSFDRLWPVLLVIVGLWLLASRLRPGVASFSSGAEEESGEVVDAFVVWGGLERALTARQFSGGRAAAVMGVIELDLRRAELAPGEQHLDLTAVMGGIELRVPETWQIKVDGTPVLGAVVDSRKSVGAAPATASESAGKGTLHLHGIAVMGGIEIKS
jgi:predicted membrane protein